MNVQDAVELLRRAAAEPDSMSLVERRTLAEQLRSISDTLLVDSARVDEDIANVESLSNDTAVPTLAATMDAPLDHVGSSSSSGEPPPSASDNLRLELISWKVADLKAALDECNVSRANLLEKRELVAALDNALQADPRKKLRVATFCDICCRTLPTDYFWPLTCKHMPCEDCLGRHLAVEAEKMQKNAKRHQPPCLFPECKTPISMGTAGEFCKRVRKLWEDLGTREKLMHGAKYEIQECPKAGCVGIAYVEPGRSTAMCFICEHQWQVGNASGDTSSQPNFSQNVRKCPKCQIPIERSWGCNHMECAKCGRKFDWDRAGFANGDLPHNQSSSSGSSHFGEFPEQGAWPGQPPMFMPQMGANMPNMAGNTANGHATFNTNFGGMGFPQQQHFHQHFNTMAGNMANGAANFAANFAHQVNHDATQNHQQQQECTLS
mmetsp:Transcript_104288/g.162546  ORF Transcript_104288/g.162546 Transcript_104288/m.162546 type:complete len:436 (+) Transcript_104288:134-1441(+)